MSSAAQSGEPGYDTSGKWPITGDGWQVIDLGRALFPGGPRACRVVAPHVSFYFGVTYKPGVAARGPQTAEITNFGRASLRTARSALDPTMLNAAYEHVSAYLLEYWQLFWVDPITRVIFVAGDGKAVEIF
jgi:hypothetical protein